MARTAVGMAALARLGLFGLLAPPGALGARPEVVSVEMRDSGHLIMERGANMDMDGKIAREAKQTLHESGLLPSLVEVHAETQISSAESAASGEGLGKAATYMYVGAEGGAKAGVAGLAGVELNATFLASLDAEVGEGFVADVERAARWFEEHTSRPSSFAALASAGDTDMSRALVLKKPADTPPDAIEEQPKTWSASAWSAYTWAQNKLKGLRGGAMNVGVTIAALGLGPDNCILKLLYILYSHEGEDDYPYMPRGCGDGFNFLISGAHHLAATPTPLLSVALIAVILRTLVF